MTKASGYGALWGRVQGLAGYAGVREHCARLKTGISGVCQRPFEYGLGCFSTRAPTRQGMYAYVLVDFNSCRSIYVRDVDYGRESKDIAPLQRQEAGVAGGPPAAL